MTPVPARLRILVALDFGDASASAATAAGFAAEALGATLTAVHVERLELPPYFTKAQTAALETERQKARRGAAEYLRAFAAGHSAMPVHPRVEEGTIADVILRVAAEFDLLVLGTHGRHGPQRWWMGSVAERVSRETPVPTVVVHIQDAGRLRRVIGATLPVLRLMLEGGGSPVLFLPAHSEGRSS